VQENAESLKGRGMMERNHSQSHESVLQDAYIMNTTVDSWVLPWECVELSLEGRHSPSKDIPLANNLEWCTKH